MGALKIGEEYVLRSLGGTSPWWTEDPIDEVMVYAGDRSNFTLCLGTTEPGGFESAGEQISGS